MGTEIRQKIEEEVGEDDEWGIDIEVFRQPIGH
jgi:hypothetical protein